MLDSDQDETAAQRAIVEFERMLNAYLRLGWVAKGTLPLKLNVVVFNDETDFHEFKDWPFAGYHVPVALFEPLVVMPRRNPDDDWTTLKHELTHYIAYQAIPNQPWWFAEGIACYFQSAHFGTHGEFVVGTVPAELLPVLRHYGRLSARRLVTVRTSPSPWLYASSWVVVHYLMSEHGGAFAHFQEALARGTRPEAAWLEAFPKLPVEKLDDAIDRYVERGDFAAYALKIPPLSVQPRIRALSDAEVYVLRAKLYLSCQGPRCRRSAQEKLRRNIELALRSDPHQLEASVMQLDELTGQRAIDQARVIVRAHPDAWLAWLALAAVELRPKRPLGRCDAEIAARLETLAPRQPYALMLGALCEAAASHNEQALALSARALSIQPGNGALLLLRTFVLLELKQCDELRKVAGRLRDVAHGRLATKTIDRLEHCQDPTDATHSK